MFKGIKVFEIDKYYIILNVLNIFKEEKKINKEILQETMKKYNIKNLKKNPEETND